MLRPCVLLFVFTFAALNAFSQQQTASYKNPALAIDERVKDLLGRMTPEEKFWQLFMIPGDLEQALPEQYKNGIFGFQVSAASKAEGETQQLLQYNTSENGLTLLRKINSIQRYFVEETRLGIPIIAFDESLHGLVREGATSFPQSIALAATFDTTMMRRVATAIAAESKARGIRQILSPVINIATDVRWGRVEETYGEDPFLTSAMGVAYVRAFEKAGIITTPKHLIANVGDGGRDSYPIHLNERYMEEIHFPPFKACFEQGGTRSVMTSYNSYDGVPASAHDWMLNKKLKQEWKFGGFVISDANATGGSVVLHNTAKDFRDAAGQAVRGGLDVIFQTDYDHHKLFIDGVMKDVDAVRIDEAVSRVLKAKFQLGLFEDPYIREALITNLGKANANKKLAKEAALKSVVLLKNNNQVLPFGRQVRSIAVFGEDAAEARLGGYSGPGNGKVSIVEGIRERAGSKLKVTYAEGCKRIDAPLTVVDASFLSNNGRPGLRGEYFNNIALTGVPLVVKNVDKIDFLWTLSAPDVAIKNDFYSVRWTGQIKSPATGNFKIGLEGNDGFRLFINDKLIADNWKKQTYSTVLSDFHFEAGKTYAIRIEFFEAVGNARLKLVWNATGAEKWAESIARAVDLAVQADLAVVVVGIHEGEFQDRAMLSLPGHQEELIQKVAATGKPVVVVLVGGSAITMTSWIDQVDGIIDVWYPGEEGGGAVAEVLFGDFNPAGRLPVTFPIHESQLPLVYNHKPTGRGDDYYNLSGLPLFPFGFGLSYTTFDYSDIVIHKNDVAINESTEVSFRVTNTGTLVGDEVSQLYIRDMLASVARPVMELKGFERITLNPGESKKITFKITPAMLQMLNAQMTWTVEPGEFKLMIGSSSRDIRLIDVLRVKG